MYKLALITFFPHIKPLETVDHIDENHSNNEITNLQWLNNGDNTRKSIKINPRKNGLKRSKPIQQWSIDENHFIADYPSIVEASKHLGFSRGNIISCLHGKLKTSYGCVWKFKNTDSDLPNEIWSTSEKLIEILKKYRNNRPLSDNALQKIRVSNMGRILTSRGIKTKGVKRERSEYRRFSGVAIHLLVWAVFGHRSQNVGEYILHDDTQPLDEEGCVSNAIQHLRIGTQSENRKECQTIGKLFKKRKMNKNNQ